MVHGTTDIGIDDVTVRTILVQVLHYDGSVGVVPFTISRTIPLSRIFLQRVSREGEQRIGQRYSINDPYIQIPTEQEVESRSESM